MNLTYLIFLLVGVIIVLLPRLKPFLMNRPWLFKKQINHEKLGRLWYVKNKKNPEYNHYQAHVLFRPVNREIDVFFDSDNEFDERQAAFLDEIEKNYHNVYLKCLKSIEDKTKVNFSVNSDLMLYAIAIAQISEKQRWELCYYSEKHHINRMTVKLEEWEIQKIET